MKRVLFTAVALVVSMLASFEAKAGTMSLAALEAPGASFTSLDGLLTFSNFTYSTVPVNSPPPATMINIVATTDGFNLQANLFAAAGTSIDYGIGYTVTAASGYTITDAGLVVAGSLFGGTGYYTVGEGLSTGSQLEAYNFQGTGVAADHKDFAGVTSLTALKDIFVSGGSSTPSQVSLVGQTYSLTSAVPEPASMALLGIGLTGLLAFRRRFKKASV